MLAFNNITDEELLAYLLSLYNSYTCKLNTSSLPTIAFSELDTRVFSAIKILNSLNFANTLFVNNNFAFLQFCQKHKIESKKINFVDAQKQIKLKSFIDRLVEIRKHKNLTPEDAKKMLENPLVVATMLLESNDIDGLVAGAQYLTSDVIRYALQIIGITENISTLSSFFLMQQDYHNLPKSISVPNKMLVADCAINIEPNQEQLTDIVLATANSAKQFLTDEPRIALLSFSTNGSANHPKVKMLQNVVKQIHTQQPELCIDGEMQLDTAINLKVREQKFPNSKLDNKLANVLIFPNLDAGNIGYKLIQRFAGSTAIGPILQGLKKPINDLSRGCSTKEIVFTAIITAIQHMDRIINQQDNIKA